MNGFARWIAPVIEAVASMRTPSRSERGTFSLLLFVGGRSFGNLVRCVGPSRLTAITMITRSL